METWRSQDTTKTMPQSPSDRHLLGPTLSPRQSQRRRQQRRQKRRSRSKSIKKPVPKLNNWGDGAVATDDKNAVLDPGVAQNRCTNWSSSPRAHTFTHNPSRRLTTEFLYPTATGGGEGMQHRDDYDRKKKKKTQIRTWPTTASDAQEMRKTMAISESLSPGPTLSPMSNHGGATALQNNDRSDNDDDEDDDESPGPDGNTGELKLFFPAPGSWKIRAPRRSIILHLPNNHPSLFPLSSHFDFPLSVFLFFYIANIPKCSRPPSLLHFNFFSFFLIFQFCFFFSLFSLFFFLLLFLQRVLWT